MEKIICVGHSADLDGLTSMAIVKYFLGNDVELYPYNYGQPIPWEKLEEATICFMVDVSFPKDDMNKLNEMLDLIYIDHHKSKMEELDLTKFKGIQRDGTAACILTWEYFSNEKVPLGVELLGKYDTWNLDDNVLNYQYGIRLLDLNPNDTPDWVYNVFFEEPSALHIKHGRIIREYIDQDSKKANKTIVYETTFDGHSALAINKLGVNSLFFNNHEKHRDVDLLIAYGYTGKFYRVSLYTNKDDVDCAVICQKYGGGGHRKAAGFQAETFHLDGVKK